MFEFIVRRKINSAFKNNKRKHAFRDMESMQNILILFTHSDWPEIESIAQDLEQKGKKVILWTSLPAIQQNQNAAIFTPNVRTITKKEKHLLQIIKQEVVKEFKNLTYDTLLDFTTKRSNTLEYLLAENGSEFCIGINETEERIYDFILLKGDNKSLSETYNQLKNYLNNINSSTN